MQRLNDHDRYEPFAPVRVLHRLAPLATDDSLPSVTLLLTAGHQITGGLATVGTDRADDVTVLAVDDGLAYVALRDVVAVVVHWPERVRDVLTAGALPAASGSGGGEVTRLGLLREFAPTDAFPTRLDESRLPTEPAQLGALRALLLALRERTEATRADAFGREAMRQVTAVGFDPAPGEGLDLRLDDGRLAIRADLSAALPRDLADHLGRRLDAML